MADDIARSRRGVRHLVLAAVLASASLVGADAGAQRFEYSGSLSASTGEFLFTEPTTSYLLNSGLLLAAERWRLGATFRILVQNSSALSYVGGRFVATGGPFARSVRDRASGEPVASPRRGRGGGSGGGGSAVVDSGAVEGPGPFEATLGDPMLDAGVELLRSSDGAVRVNAQGFVKLPLADPASGVGTGEFDFGGGLTLAAARNGTFFFADFSHWILGDLPDLPLRDLTSLALGVGRSYGEMGRWSLMGSASASTAVIADTDPAVSTTAGIGLMVAERRFLNASLTIGFTESTPDWGVSLGWRLGLPRSGWER